MTPLLTDLTFEDSSAIIRDLERQAIPYQTTNVAIMEMGHGLNPAAAGGVAE